MIQDKLDFESIDEGVRLFNAQLEYQKKLEHEFPKFYELFGKASYEQRMTLMRQKNVGYGH